MFNHHKFHLERSEKKQKQKNKHKNKNKQKQNRRTQGKTNKQTNKQKRHPRCLFTMVIKKDHYIYLGICGRDI